MMANVAILAAHFSTTAFPAAAVPAILAAVTVGPPTAPASRGAPVEVGAARMLMGTLCNAVAVDPDSTRARHALAGSLDEIARLEDVMSSWKPASELRSLNASAGAPFACSADLHAVLDSARALAEATGGAFDPTVEPLSRAWDLRGEGRIPSREEVRQARALVNWQRLRLEPESRSATLETPGMGLDLGGIGKGFALDRAAAELRARGVRNALLNFGGELLAMGSPAASEEGWEVTVAHPDDRLRPVVRLEVLEAAVSTSAQSERGFTRRGRRYGHVLDPRTGLPLAGRGSVTVVAPSATRADALSTAFLVLGRERSAEWWRRHPSVGVLWLEPDGAGVRAWAWNLPSAVALPGARVIWRTSPSAVRAVQHD